MIYSQGIFKGVFDGFDAPEVLPVVKVGPVHVAEAWHGPTGVFKDLTLHVLARLSDHFLEKRGQRATILVSTTGDTGGTTIRSVQGMKNLRAIVAYPRHTVSRVQELQMTTTGSENAVVFSHDGISDDLDLILRNIFRDGELRKRHTLLSFNSIHTVRVLLNIVHFVYVYLRVAPKADRSVLVSVPTGGVGNAAGGVMAAEMGVPIKILSAVNENDVVHRAFTLGDFSIARAQIPTHAPSLDSNLPHNVERVFYFALNGDTAALKRSDGGFRADSKERSAGGNLRGLPSLSHCECEQGAMSGDHEERVGGVWVCCVSPHGCGVETSCRICQSKRPRQWRSERGGRRDHLPRGVKLWSCFRQRALQNFPRLSR